MLIAALGQYFFGITIFVSSLFLIMLVLVQRGRGGGLAGALGGPGGQSAFGTKAGDLFTRITIVVATVWIFLCASAVYFLKAKKFTTSGGKSNAAVTSEIGGTDDDASPLTGETPNGASLPNLNLDSDPVGGEAEITDLPSLEPTTPEPTTPEPTTPEPAPAGEGDAAADSTPEPTTPDPDSTTGDQ